MDKMSYNDKIKMEEANMKLYFNQVKDSPEGLMVYIAENYGKVFVCGDIPAEYHRAIRLCKRVAKMTGVDLKEVVGAITELAQMEEK